jgi:hypothetical protein
VEGKTMRWILRPTAVLVVAVLALTGGYDSAGAKQEQPVYTVASTEGDFEIRDYDTMVLAEYTMRGSYSKRSSSRLDPRRPHAV